jgi:hypothetical protein
VAEQIKQRAKPFLHAIQVSFFCETGLRQENSTLHFHLFFQKWQGPHVAVCSGKLWLATCSSSVPNAFASNFSGWAVPTRIFFRGGDASIVCRPDLFGAFACLPLSDFDGVSAAESASSSDESPTSVKDEADAAVFRLFDCLLESVHGSESAPELESTSASASFFASASLCKDASALGADSAPEFELTSASSASLCKPDSALGSDSVPAFEITSASASASASVSASLWQLDSALGSNSAPEFDSTSGSALLSDPAEEGADEAEDSGDDIVKAWFSPG